MRDDIARCAAVDREHRQQREDHREHRASTERLAGEVLSLPIFPGMLQEQRVRVVEQISEFFRGV